MLALSLFICCIHLAILSVGDRALRLPLYRRGGRLVQQRSSNLTESVKFLRKVENRYCHTYRDIKNNCLVRRWITDQDDHSMFDEIGYAGSWYTIIDVGYPPQKQEVDLDFLTPDFYTLLTTSSRGSKFNTFASQSHAVGNTFAHPLCRLSSDQFYLPNRVDSIHLEWPVCQPSRSSRHTLSNSGTVLGLAPNPLARTNSLSRITAPTFIHTLCQRRIISSTIWYLTIFDSMHGVLTLGGTLAAELEETKIRAEAELKYFGQENGSLQVQDEVRSKMAFSIPTGSSIEDHFKWTDVSGPAGWWTGLMSGVFVDGVKILKNQPFLIDLSCPFIIAPPTAFKRLYNSVGGSKPLNLSSYPVNDRTQEAFYLFPCLNPPSISLEIAGWPFPLTPTSRSTQEDMLNGPAGGPFSLGKMKDFIHANRIEDEAANKISGVNSGFCVGIVVQSDMGGRDEQIWRDSGMRDVWVLGEPFFKGLGVAFDEGSNDKNKARIGFRTY